jgi:lysophospholipase L1-like esterase
VPDAVLGAVWVACVLACAAGLRRLARRREAGTRGGVGRILAGNALVLALLLLTLLGVAETWLRSGADLSDGLVATRLGRRWFDRHWHTNGVGVRDDVEYGPGGRLALAPPPGVRRLTLLGDSVTAGQGVPDVADRFANRVRVRLGPDFEVHVFAEGGFETGDELAALRELFARGYRTDRVLLAYFPNDITDLLPDWQDALARIWSDWPRLHATLRGSYALDFAWWRLRLACDPDVRRYRETVRAAYEGDAWTAQQQRLLALRDAVRDGGAQLAVVTLPFFEVAGDAQADTLARIDRFWRAAGVPHLDLGPHFAGRDPATLVANRWDEHPNAAAHGEIAEEILRFLAQLDR